MTSRASPLGLSGRLAAHFQAHALTPLLAWVLVLLGAFAVLVTPREEEPQIDVTMIDVLVPFPGAGSADVQNMVARPLEQALAQMAGLEHTFSVSRPGMALVTVQFQVGVKRSDALVRLQDVLHLERERWPPGLGVLAPIVKAKGIDDVPILTLTFWQAEAASASDLQAMARSLEVEIKATPGVREVGTLGAPGRAVHVWIDAQKLRERGLDLLGLKRALGAAHAGSDAGTVADSQPAAGVRPGDAGGLLLVRVGEFLRSESDVAELVVGAHQGRPVYLRDVARVVAQAREPVAYVTHVPGGLTAPQQPTAYPAVTMTVTKKPGANAVEVAHAVQQRIEQLRNTVIPADVRIDVTRDYGKTAGAKANQLMQKLAFATASVIILVGLALGRREAVIVGIAVILTLLSTLFASWAWGFTLNRVSLFALIFSIGILVDDAIVVVENIHRHQSLAGPGASLREIIPKAVDEVGGPTILATATVVAALLPMAFVSGLMGPYMSPIPINSSLGMGLSLLIAFTITPWLALRLLKHHGSVQAHPTGTQGAQPPAPAPSRSHRVARRVLAPFLSQPRKRRLLGAGIALAMLLSIGLAGVQWVVLKMLPFDNKSEFQVVVDRPTGGHLEDTAALLGEMALWLAQQPEVKNVQTYAGAPSPLSFNGLVRQYDRRVSPELGDLQVNLVDKGQRKEQSHAIAQRLRPKLEAMALAHGARVKVVEVPPGPPVLSPIVAEVYGPDEGGRQQLALRVADVFRESPDIVGVDSSVMADAPRALLRVRRQRADALGVSVAAIAQTVQDALSGADAAWLHDGRSKVPTPVRVALPRVALDGLDAVLALPVRTTSGALVVLAELVDVERDVVDKALYTKDLAGVSYVVGDVGRRERDAQIPDSPLYGLFGIRTQLAAASPPDTPPLAEMWVRQPPDMYRQYAIKWDGEWQITYETFRDMGAAYAVGLVLIYLLVVAQFRNYVTPLVIMAPIPLTLVGVMPGHALIGAPFTATSMIGMIALAGIIVRNSILLVDFIDLQLARGVALREAVIEAAAVRAQPIALTALAAMTGAFFILDDPIFNGLAISLIFGIFVSTVLTLLVIPVLYGTVHEWRDKRRATARA